MSDIRVNLTLPVLRLGLGPFAFDPLERLVGARIGDLLEPVMSGPVVVRPSVSGPAVEVYPLRLPEGEGASVALGQLGELGFANDRGRLALTVPLLASRWLAAHLGGAIVEGPIPRVAEGGARVAAYLVVLRPGMRASWPLGALGEVGIEAA